MLTSAVCNVFLIGVTCVNTHASYRADCLQGWRNTPPAKAARTRWPGAASAAMQALASAVTASTDFFTTDPLVFGDVATNSPLSPALWMIQTRCARGVAACPNAAPPNNGLGVTKS